MVTEKLLATSHECGEIIAELRTFYETNGRERECSSEITGIRDIAMFGSDGETDDVCYRNGMLHSH
jgi:hypothetical protein